MKDVLPWPFPRTLDGFIWRLSQRIIISTVGFIGKFILSKCSVFDVVEIVELIAQLWHFFLFQIS